MDSLIIIFMERSLKKNKKEYMGHSSVWFYATKLFLNSTLRGTNSLTPFSTKKRKWFCGLDKNLATPLNPPILKAIMKEVIHRNTSFQFEERSRNMKSLLSIERNSALAF